ncbi:rhomboid family intramembrane serine protease [Pseudooceanicola aestuarii]|uniref:rhomboid family intramembrane serine protease n=1 Tax=Pseudooceanicola aestuarii TaxID=2697319 RepID=UPI0013D5B097|nr:rhomboid family intramembrane serine protease [Pseudooceanicola aestuarii]
MSLPDHQPPEYPVNPLPPVVTALFLVIIGIELLFTLAGQGIVGGPGAVGWRVAAIQDYAFAVPVMDWILTNQALPPELAIRFASYVFVHGSLTQGLFAGVMVLALGKFVGEIMHPLALLTVFFVSAILGALAFGLLAADPRPLYGAFPAVYGLIGAFTYILWVNLGAVGANRVAAFRLIGMLMAIQLVFGLLFQVGQTWIADLAGFVAGFALAPVLLPGGIARLRARLRRD